MPTSNFLPIGVHGGQITEGWDHTAVHNGQVFRAGVFQTIGAGSVLSVMMTTGASENVHFRIELNTNAPGIAQFSEAPNATGGTAVGVKNALRSSSNTSNVTVTVDPTFVSAGTLIGTTVLGSEGFRSVSGGQTESEVWILKPSTKYIVRFTADNASSRSVIKMIWVED